MKQRLLVVVLAAVSTLAPMLVVETSAAAVARASLLRVEDRRGDVTITDREGPTPFRRKSIDLTEVRATLLDEETAMEPAVRFTFRIRMVTEPSHMVQRIDVSLTDADPASPDVVGDIVVTLQDSRTMAYADVSTDNQSAGIACMLHGSSVVTPRGLVKVVVPIDCLPPGLLSVRVRTSTVGPGGGPEGAFSRDSVRVPGAYDLGGTAGK
jgi:hypothetical protein